MEHFAWDRIFSQHEFISIDPQNMYLPAYGTYPLYICASELSQYVNYNKTIIYDEPNLDIAVELI